MARDEAIIIGCGIIGLTTGFQLSRAGIKVTCIDKGIIGAGSSSVALGYVSPPPNHEAHKQFTDLAVKSLRMYSDFISELASVTKDDYDLNRNGYLHVAFSEDELPVLRRMYNSWVRAGLSILPLNPKETLQIEPLVSPKILQSLLMEDALSVNPREIMGGLAKAIRILGGDIIENVNVKNLVLNNDTCVGVNSDNGLLKSNFVVVSAGSWSSSLISSLVDKEVKPIKGQAVILKSHSHPTPTRPISTNHGVDILPRQNGEVVAGTTTEYLGFDELPTAVVAHEILSKAFDVVPVLKNYQIIGTRAGLRPCTGSTIPIIGPHPEYKNLIISTGHCQDGVLLAPITAHLVESFIANKEISIEIDEFMPIVKI